VHRASPGTPIQLTTLANTTTSQPQTCSQTQRRSPRRISAQVCHSQRIWLRIKVLTHGSFRKGLTESNLKENTEQLKGKRPLDDEEPDAGNKAVKRRRSRSIASFDSDSVSTISTNSRRSPSPLPPPRRRLSSSPPPYRASRKNASRFSPSPPQDRRRRQASSRSPSIHSDSVPKSRSKRSYPKEPRTRNSRSPRSPSPRRDRSSNRSRSRSRRREHRNARVHGSPKQRSHAGSERGRSPLPILRHESPLHRRPSPPLRRGELSPEGGPNLESSPPGRHHRSTVVTTDGRGVRAGGDKGRVSAVGDDRIRLQDRRTSLDIDRDAGSQTYKDPRMDPRSGVRWDKYSGKAPDFVRSKRSPSPREAPRPARERSLSPYSKRMALTPDMRGRD